MQFNHIKHNIIRPFAKEEHTDTGHYYRTEKGDLYPSITTIIKKTENMDWYQHWVNSIAVKMDLSNEDAEKECKRIGNESMEVGTALHKYAEMHLNNNNQIRFTDEKQWSIDPLELFNNSLKPHIDEHINNIHGSELKVYSDEMKLAGTIDLVAEYDGMLSIIDFKNSRKPKQPAEIKKKKYYEQATAYSEMFKFCTQIDIEQIVIMVISWDGKVRPFKSTKTEHLNDLWNILLEHQTNEALK